MDWCLGMVIYLFSCFLLFHSLRFRSGNLHGQVTILRFLLWLFQYVCGCPGMSMVNSLPLMCSKCLSVWSDQRIFTRKSPYSADIFLSLSVHIISVICDKIQSTHFKIFIIVPHLSGQLIFSSDLSCTLGQILVSLSVFIRHSYMELSVNSTHRKVISLTM